MIIVGDNLYVTCFAAIKSFNLAEWLERLAVDAQVATVLGSIPPSPDTVESEGRQMKQCWMKYIKIKH